jgi:hypothetical protein
MPHKDPEARRAYVRAYRARHPEKKHASDVAYRARLWNACLEEVSMLCIPWLMILVGFWLIRWALLYGSRLPYVPTIAPPPSPEQLARERAQAQEDYRQHKERWAKYFADNPWLLDERL